MTPGASRRERRAPFATRRLFLWTLLVVLIAALLAMLVWLAGRYEESQVQDRLDRDAAEAVSDLRGALMRNVESLQALHSRSQGQPEVWSRDASRLLVAHRELLRIEWRDTALVTQMRVESTFRSPVFERLGRASAQSDVARACGSAQRTGGPGYAPSYFLPQMEGMGLEVMDLCMPFTEGGAVTGYLVATYSLSDALTELIGKQIGRGQDVSFTEADGTRLAFHGTSRRGNHAFTSTQLVDLPGFTMMLRLDSWRVMPDLFPNVLTAMVVAMTIALASVLVLLNRDMRKRQRVEQSLGEALAFRKAMEDSLVTGLRARDLHGNTTYVNPAFCQMLGFSARELLGPVGAAPYWPTELAGEYQLRQAIRLQGNSPPREGFESVFMRKDGSRFPVLIIEAPLIDAHGVQTGWMSAFLDISEQRRIEELSRASHERLQATARLATVGEMASLLSHELNQPLAAISSFATGSINMLQDANHSDKRLEEAMRHIAEQAQRAGKVIKSVHDVVRRRDNAREAVEPHAVLDAIRPLVSLQAHKLGVRLDVRIDGDLPPLLCDRTMVEQVLLNLIRNAMQAMDGSAHVDRRVVIQIKRAASSERTSHTHGWLDFSVADGGPGITPEVAGKLFTPFFTTKAEGMGLGLSLCRTVVEQHGGFLEFGPNHPQGTVFRFTLPASSVAQALQTI